MNATHFTLCFPPIDDDLADEAAPVTLADAATRAYGEPITPEGIAKADHDWLMNKGTEGFAIIEYGDWLSTGPSEFARDYALMQRHKAPPSDLAAIKAMPPKPELVQLPPEPRAKPALAGLSMMRPIDHRCGKGGGE